MERREEGVRGDGRVVSAGASERYGREGDRWVCFWMFSIQYWGRWEREGYFVDIDILPFHVR